MDVSLDDIPAPINVPVVDDQPPLPAKSIPPAKKPAAKLSKSKYTPKGATSTSSGFLPQKPVKRTEPRRSTTILKDEAPTFHGITEETKIQLSSEEKKALTLGPVVPKLPPLGDKYKNEKVSFHGAF